MLTLGLRRRSGALLLHFSWNPVTSVGRRAPCAAGNNSSVAVCRKDFLICNVAGRQSYI